MIEGSHESEGAKLALADRAAAIIGSLEAAEILTRLEEPGGDGRILVVHGDLQPVSSSRVTKMTPLASRSLCESIAGAGIMRLGIFGWDRTLLSVNRPTAACRAVGPNI